MCLCEYLLKASHTTLSEVTYNVSVLVRRAIGLVLSTATGEWALCLYMFSVNRQLEVTILLQLSLSLFSSCWDNAVLMCSAELSWFSLLEKCPEGALWQITADTTHWIPYTLLTIWQDSTGNWHRHTQTHTKIHTHKLMFIPGQRCGYVNTVMGTVHCIVYSSNLYSCTSWLCFHSFSLYLLGLEELSVSRGQLPSLCASLCHANRPVLSVCVCVGVCVCVCVCVCVVSECHHSLGCKKKAKIYIFTKENDKNKQQQ